MISNAVLAAIHARLVRELAPPQRPYRPFRVDGATAGWLDDERAECLARFSNVLDVRPDRIVFAPGIDDRAARTAAMDIVTRRLASDGALTAWRGERYAIAAEVDEQPWFLLERAAARFFGVRTWAAHVNGLVRRADDIAMWIARRAATKSIDPLRLDNLVGGGVATGQSPASTVVKEAFEEAGIESALATQARAVGALQICREQPDGMQRETIFAYDLWLPADFAPACRDGEVIEHRLVPIREAGALIANTTGQDVITADASLVMVDCLLRHGAIPPDAPLRGALEGLGRPAGDGMGAVDR